MASYLTKPIYMFGWGGVLAFAISLASALIAVSMKYLGWPHKASFIQTPLPVLSMVMFVLGIQFFMLGLIAEMLVRTYHESQGKQIYAIRTKINFDRGEEDDGTNGNNGTHG